MRFDPPLVEGILLQVHHIQQHRFLPFDKVLHRDPLFTRDLHHPVDPITILQQLLHLFDVANPVGVDVFGKPVGHLVQVARPGDQWIDRRVKPAIGSLCR